MLKIPMLIFVASLTVVVLGLSNEPAEAKPGYCHYFGIDIKEGANVPAPIGRCVQLVCINAAKNQVTAKECALIAPPKQGCKLKLEDPVAPYPDCCAKFICGDGN